MQVKKEDAKKVTALIKELFKTHDIETEEHDGWLIPMGSDYAMKGYWYPEVNENVGQLTIELFINSEMIMVESFAGMGESESKRLQYAFSAFVHNSFHTFLFAIWDVSSDAVDHDEWKIGEKSYDVYRGTKGIMNFDKERIIEVPNSYNEKVKEKIMLETLENEFHWFTLFYANLNGLESTVQVLKDNRVWGEGEKVLRSLNWKRSNHYYSVRQFIILKEKK